MAYKFEFHPEAEAELDEALSWYQHSLFFTLEGKTVFVHAIFHQSRDPKIWQERATEN